MKLKYAVSLIALSVASTSALAAAQSTGQDSSAFMNQQLAAMTNSTGVTPTADWYNRIQVSGLLNLDVFAQNNAKYLQTTANSDNSGANSAFNISTLALNVDSQVNDWISGHVGLFYATDDQPDGISARSGTGALGRNTRYYPSDENGDVNGEIGGIDVDEAYVDIMNFNKAPVDFRLGRQYFGYGQYDRYAMMPTLTQQMTELRGVGPELNFVHSSGLHADAFGFRGLKKSGEDNWTPRNFGGTIGYTGVVSKIGFDVNAGYLYNLNDVGYFAQYLPSNVDTNRAGGWNANGALMMGPFKLGLQYAAALSKMKDFYYKHDLNEAPKEAKPSAGNIYASYAFKTAGYNSKLTAGYQWSGQALTTTSDGSTDLYTLPESRVAAEYDINVLKNTMLGFEANYDSAYSKNHNGTGDNSLAGIARLSVLL